MAPTDGRSQGLLEETQPALTKGNVFPQARSEQGLQRTDCHPGWVYSGPTTHFWLSCFCYRKGQRGRISHVCAHFWRMANTMLAILVAGGMGVGGWLRSSSPNPRSVCVWGGAPSNNQNQLNKCCQMFAIFSSANVNAWQLSGRG